MRRLVRFVAGCYNGGDFLFDLSELRELDNELAEACIAYLITIGWGVREVHGICQAAKRRYTNGYERT